MPDLELPDPIPADEEVHFDQSINHVDMRPAFKSKPFLEARNSPEGKYSMRPEFVLKSNSERKVRTNHFSMKLPKQLFKYSIGLPDDDTFSRAKKKDLIQQFFHKSGLVSQRSDFATDYLSTIVSWKDLRTDSWPQDPQDQAVVKTAIPCGKTKGGDGQVIDKNVTVSLYEQGAIDIQIFNEITRGNQTPIPAVVNDVERSINLLISEATSRIIGRNRTFKVGANRFFNKAQWTSLDTRFVCHHGFFTTVKAAMGHVLLNVNTATSAFLKPMTVSEFIRLSKEAGRPSWETARILKGVRVWIDYERGTSEVDNGKNGKMPNPLNTPQRRTRTITGVSEKMLKEITFMKDGKYVSVFSHLSSTYDELKHILDRNSVCINLGNTNAGKESWFAPETLRILAYQPYREKLNGFQTQKMLKLACRKPEGNIARIMTAGLQSMGFGATNVSSVYEKSGLSINKRMMSVPARCIESGDTKTSVKYGGGTSDFYILKNGGWTLGGKFYNTDTPLKGAPIHYIYHPGALDKIGKDKLHKEFRERLHGLGIEFKTLLSNFTELRDFTDETLKRSMADANGASLVVFISKNEDAYFEFKRLADREHGVHSVCMLAEKLEKHWGDGRKVQGYLGKVAMKVNLKLGNVNHIIRKGLGTANGKNPPRLMIMGADVTHPTVASPAGMPSVAAVVGSVDKNFGKFLGSMRWQKPEDDGTESHPTGQHSTSSSADQKDFAKGGKNDAEKRHAGKNDKAKDTASARVAKSPKDGKKSKEIITGMRAMAKERIEAYFDANNGSLPTHILYYRDGVSSSQYDEIKEKEVKGIRDAFGDVQRRAKIKNINLEITAVIVSKRHHTRFYPPSSAQEDIEKIAKNGNVLPGTVVESGITSPCYFDFFLVSHEGIQGTSKPAHYFVIENGMKFSAQELQDLTQRVCCLYPRADKSVSYASPAYYADRLCERGRVYLQKFFNGQGEWTKDCLIEDIEKMWKGDTNPWHVNMSKNMFWM
ncbi:Protein argonaute 1-like [Neofusicoccum parvum]|nr:Protein argonaute 1-like [Neofusicoccum parvum]